ncbi:PEP [Urbanus proteus nucleopolyhedrovirus]|uniref:PEP n=1 Tax=Urbanus proteus nucleopolyhedrovirus TaxID=1675866 RepID=A0A162GV09_9ABAC|nr:PEP [Urbanus proteus nucleopolyhedrovirus]AKR17386.1 PEP [Urbanus proteus nucleopolyhedrovirus]
MSFNVLSKPYQDCHISAFLDNCCIFWISADDTLQLLRLPPGVLQSIPLRHKKCWSDFQNSNCAYRCDNSKVFIDLYGLGLLCAKINSNTADYLMTAFVAEIYKECLDNGPNVSQLCPKPTCDRCSRHNHHHDHDHSELLERIARQNDQILINLTQLSINNSNQHLEITNLLNSIKLQNVQILNNVSQILELIETQFNELSTELTTLLRNLNNQLNSLTEQLTNAIAQLQDTLRNELLNINSILNNLVSSITNINTTLNNVLQILNNLNLGNINSVLQEVLTLLQEIIDALFPFLSTIKKGTE